MHPRVTNSYMKLFVKDFAAHFLFWNRSFIRKTCGNEAPTCRGGRPAWVRSDHDAAWEPVLGRRAFFALVWPRVVVSVVGTLARFSPCHSQL
jgi:hypothetical protein